MRIIYQLLTLGLLWSSTLRAQTDTTAWGNASSEHQTSSDEQRLKATQYYYRGVLEAVLGSEGEAETLLGYAHKLDPTDGDIAYALGRLYAGKDKGQQALDLLSLAYRSDTTNQSYLETLALLYASRGSTQNAIEILEEWLQRRPDSERIWQLLSTIYYHSGELVKAIDLCTRQQREHTNEYSEYARLGDLKVALWEATGDKDKAVEELKHIATAFPDELQATARLVEYLLSNDKATESLPYIDRLQERGYATEGVREFRILYAMYAHDQEDISHLMLELLEDESVSVDKKVEYWYRYFVRQRDDKGFSKELNTSFERLISLHPGELAPLFTYAQVLRLQEDYRKAIEVLRPLTLTAPDNPEVWRSLIGDALSLEDEELITELSLEAIEHIHTDWRYYLYATIGIYKQGDSRRAIALLEAALPNLKDIDTQGYSTVLAYIGDLYHEEANATKAYEYYDLALEANPNNVDVLNNYAYFLAESEEQLDKAERLAARGMTITPSNANLLDTYAWILHKRGKHSLARLHQSRAIDAAGADVSGVMYHHLGDIHAALGEKAESLQAWRKALELYQDELSRAQESEKKAELTDKINLLNRQINNP